jgi:hypothetical protein
MRDIHSKIFLGGCRFACVAFINYDLKVPPRVDEGTVDFLITGGRPSMMLAPMRARIHHQESHHQDRGQDTCQDAAGEFSIPRNVCLTRGLEFFSHGSDQAA